MYMTMRNLYTKLVYSVNIVRIIIAFTKNHEVAPVYLKQLAMSGFCRSGHIYLMHNYVRTYIVPAWLVKHVTMKDETIKIF